MFFRFYFLLAFFKLIGLEDKLEVSSSEFIFRSNEFIPGDGDDSGSTENDGDYVILRPSSWNALPLLFVNFSMPLSIDQRSNLKFSYIWHIGLITSLLGSTN